MNQKPFLWRIFLSFLAIILLSLFTITWYTTGIISDFYRKDTARNLEERARLTARQITLLLLQENYSSIRQNIANWNKEARTRITIILPDGKVIADSKYDPESMENHRNRPEIQQAFDDTIGFAIRFSTTLQQNFVYVALPVKADDQTIAVIRAALPMTIFDETLYSLQQKFLLAGLVIALLTAFFTWLLSRKLSAPLDQITIAIQHFAKGDFTYRLPNNVSGSIGRITIALNKMAAQLHDKIKTIDRQKNEQQAVFQSMTEGVVAVDRYEQIISINNAASRLLGCEEQPVLGRKFSEVIHYPRLQQIITETLANKKMIEEEITVTTATRHFVHVHGTILQNREHKTIGVLLVLNDITRLRRLEQVRRDFVANVSHEIRTPLTSIKGFVETLSDGAIDEPETARHFLDIISKQTNRLDFIIEDLLLLARLEQDEERAAIRFETERISHVIESALQVCRPKAERKGISITVDCSPSVHIAVNATLIEQALINLIENAVKYSSERTQVTLRCYYENSNFIIEVSDQGMGIAEEHLNRIFERFYRVDKARSRKLGGTGLGLAIVKHIAGVHGGRVTVTSKIGEGSTFRLYLPI